MIENKMKINIDKSTIIFKNAIVEYNDGFTKVFEAVYLDNKEIVYGKILEDNIFLKCGGIPKDNIHKIIVLDKEGKQKILL